MNTTELKDRTREFAVFILKFVEDLPNTVAGRTIGNQIIRSGTSVGANYRSACRARSKADFISKITIVEEEADETLFWLEIAKAANITNTPKLPSLMKEAAELTAIFTASGKTAKMNRNKK